MTRTMFFAGSMTLAVAFVALQIVANHHLI